jgi:hypothetical protein
MRQLFTRDTRSQVARTSGAPEGSTYLPTDCPPRPGATNMAGIVTHASLGEHFYPLNGAVFSPLQSDVFPNWTPSSVAPNGLRPTWVVAINTYSPIAHRSGLTTTVPPKAGDSRGTARSTQRPRGYAPGYVTRWPQVAPRWPTFGESGNIPSGGT